MKPRSHRFPTHLIRLTIHAPPPEQGEHTDAILGKLGYDGEAIAGLHEDGVI